ncbi:MULTISPECIES: TetR/AcrR family transcriptional regulator [Halomicrobium]|uniref:Transcriptional regulator, TetR family n=2 Tax=Halomicrobium mukohataei TaxID=57705 RepID=C7P499_HALMD|nr:MULTISPECIES: TetR/AcrR family transcriptional regulator [Halomicrobium]ACV47921.1 transcriptional regulator, TetR family [Halomicrobium mukohataei DSM 12286]QCD66359.1 TetR/AcrR family transcriptional regulator [Halomicrobium mukohataei]QFR21164.1 TetR family transcriptional regulator [Halomicrobium sp. ZPS1]
MEDEPATEILHATYRALCDHGYANLTVQDIAAEADRSTASIHYHYDDKDQLFVAFLDYLYDRYTERLADVDEGSPRDRLDALFDVSFDDGPDGPQQAFRTAMLEVTAQAPYDDAIRDRLAEFDELLFEQLRETIADGVETGVFDDRVDPAVAAEFLTATITGAHTREVAAGAPSDRLYAALTEYTERHLLAAGSTGVAD